MVTQTTEMTGTMVTAQVARTTRTIATRWLGAVVVPAAVMVALGVFVVAETAVAQPPDGRGGRAGRMGRQGRPGGGPGGHLM